MRKEKTIKSNKLLRKQKFTNPTNKKIVHPTNINNTRSIIHMTINHKNLSLHNSVSMKVE